MKKVNMVFLILLTMVSSEIFAQALTQDQKKQRIVASYRVAVGRAPVQGEIDHWMRQADLTVQQLVDYHMQYAGRETSFKKEIIERSYKHALGRPATTGPNSELEWWLKQIPQSYVQMMRNHVNWLDQNKNTTAYNDVINLAYQRVYGRNATDAERSSWKAKSTTSYGMLVSALKDHAIRGNQGVLGQITRMANDFMNAFPITDNQTVQQIGAILGSTPQGKVLAEGTGAITSVIGSILPFFNL